MLKYKDKLMLLNCSVQENTVVLEKTLQSPLGCKIKPVHPKGNQSWIFIGGTDAEAPILWLPDAKSHLIGEDPDARKDWRQEEKETTEDKMVGWLHWLNGHEFEKGPGVGDGQGSLACCSPWGCKESDTTEQLNWELEWNLAYFTTQRTSSKEAKVLLSWHDRAFGNVLIHEPSKPTILQVSRPERNL